MRSWFVWGCSKSQEAPSQNPYHTQTNALCGNRVARPSTNIPKIARHVPCWTFQSPRIWHIDRSYLTTALREFYEDSPLNITRILDVSQDHEVKRLSVTCKSALLIASIQLLQRSAKSQNPRDHEILACTLHSIFDEYKFFNSSYYTLPANSKSPPTSSAPSSNTNSSTLLLSALSSASS